MPAIARLRTYGQHAWRDRDRLVECLRYGEPFYMASITGGPIEPGMNPSGGRERLSVDFTHAIQRGEIDYMIWSYETPIAWRYMGQWKRNQKKYSRTTTNHQSIIRSAIATLEG